MSSSYLLDTEAVGIDEVWSTAYVNDSNIWTGGLDGHLRCFNTAQSKEIATASVSASTSTSAGNARPLGIVSLDATESFVVTNQLSSQLTRWALEESHQQPQNGDQGDENTAARKHPHAVRKQATASLGANATWAISLHPTEEIVATAGAGATLKLLKASVQGFGEEVHHTSADAAATASSAGAKGDFASCCKISPDGKLVAVSTTNGQVFLSDAATGHLLQSFPAHSKNIRALSFSSDSGLLITGSDDKRINLFDIRGASRRQAGGGHVASLEGHPGWVLSLASRSDGKTLASGSSDGAVKLWDLSQTSNAFTTLQSEKDVWSLSWRPHDLTAAAGFEGIGGSGVGGGQFVAGTSAGLQWWRSTS